MKKGKHHEEKRDLEREKVGEERTLGEKEESKEKESRVKK